MTDDQNTTAQTDQPGQTRLQRWGSKSTPLGNAVFFLIVLPPIAAIIGGLFYFLTLNTDDRLARVESLDSRYAEKIDIDLVPSGASYTDEVITIDGQRREDCTETDDGYLKCTEDPQPTPTFEK